MVIAVDGADVLSMDEPQKLLSKLQELVTQTDRLETNRVKIKVLVALRSADENLATPRTRSDTFFSGLLDVGECTNEDMGRTISESLKEIPRLSEA